MDNADLTYSFINSISLIGLNITLFLLFTVIGIIFHELGHAFMFKVFGGRVTFIKLGMGRQLFSFKIGKTKVAIHWLLYYAGVFGHLNKFSHFRIKLKVILLGGIIVNLALALVGHISAGLSFNWLQEVNLGSLIAIANYHLLLNAIIPFKIGKLKSDGYRIMKLMVKPTVEVKEYKIKYQVSELQHLMQNKKYEEVVQLASTMEYKNEIEVIWYKAEALKYLKKYKEAQAYLEANKEAFFLNMGYGKDLIEQQLLYYIYDKKTKKSKQLVEESKNKGEFNEAWEGFIQVEKGNRKQGVRMIEEGIDPILPKYTKWEMAYLALAYKNSQEIEIVSGMEKGKFFLHNMMRIESDDPFWLDFKSRIFSKLMH